MTDNQLIERAEAKYPYSILIGDRFCVLQDKRREAYISAYKEAIEEMGKVWEAILRTRISELNEADASFCIKRWDVDVHPLVRSEMRNQSNSVTFARQELEGILQKLGLPRFVEAPPSINKGEK